MADQLRYADVRPYVVPDTLGELTGPATGVVDLPTHLAWSGLRSYDLDDERQLGLPYETVIRESMDVADVDRYLNAAVLGRVIAVGTAVVAASAGIDWRAHPPVTLGIGAVLHPDDAVANKLAALYGRAADRDYVDVDAVLRSGRYSSADLLHLAHGKRILDSIRRCASRRCWLPIVCLTKRSNFTD
ncbi:MAG: hypothetical protein ACRDSP_14670 [Pseudonocardiaceae bacterium]